MCVSQVGTVSEAYPHLIFDNMTSQLGQRCANILKVHTHIHTHTHTHTVASTFDLRRRELRQPIRWTILSCVRMCYCARGVLCVLTRSTCSLCPRTTPSVSLHLPTDRTTSHSDITHTQNLRGPRQWSSQRYASHTSKHMRMHAHTHTYTHTQKPRHCPSWVLCIYVFACDHVFVCVCVTAVWAPLRHEAVSNQARYS